MPENTDQTDNKGGQQAVTFDDAQKDAISKIIEERIGRQNKKHSEELAAAQAAKDAAENALKEEREKSGKKKEDSTDAEKDQFKHILEGEKKLTLQERQAREAAEARIKAVEQENKRIVKDVAIRDAIQDQDTFQFHDVNVVKTLTERFIHFDEDTGKHVIKDENGVIRQNNALQPMTLKEFFSQFASQHPYLVTSNVKGGSGAGESNRSGGGMSKITSKADFKNYQEKVEYITKFGGEAYEKLPLK
jgi:hypothetical protein